MRLLRMCVSAADDKHCGLVHTQEGAATPKERSPRVTHALIIQLFLGKLSSTQSTSQSMGSASTDSISQKPAMFVLNIDEVLFSGCTCIQVQQLFTQSLPLIRGCKQSADTLKYKEDADPLHTNAVPLNRKRIHIWSPPQRPKSQSP